MNPAIALPRAEPFFLPADEGQRFCLYHPAAGACRGAIVYLHPFGDEMNKARRMAALQARAFAAAGYAVLQIDLHGCGDSSGEFGEASWDSWKQDVRLAHEWLARRLGQPVSLWGLRLGALLALDYARSAALPLARLVLWHPVQSGATFLTQFLRMKMASQLLAGDTDKGGTKALRDVLRQGVMLEVAGYELAPAMADALEALDSAALAVRHCPVHYFDLVAPAAGAMSPATGRLRDAWIKAGVELHLHTVACLPFWATQEIAECPALIAATSAALSESA